MKTLLALSLLFGLFGCDNERPQGAFKMYEYTYSGTMAYPIRYYCVEKNAESGEVTLAWCSDDPEVKIIRVDSGLPDQIDSLVREYKLWRLKDAYRPPVRVLDGYGWSLRVRYEQNTISSHGSNAWPGPQLRTGFDSVNNLLEELIGAATEADIIDRQPYHKFRDDRDR